MVCPELINGLEAVEECCITMSGEAGTERTDPCRLHAALMGDAKGYVRSLLSRSSAQRWWRASSSAGSEPALEVAVRQDKKVSAGRQEQKREYVPLERQQLVFCGGLQEDARNLASISFADSTACLSPSCLASMFLSKSSTAPSTQSTFN